MHLLHSDARCAGHGGRGGLEKCFARVTFATSTSVASVQAKELIVTTTGKKHDWAKHRGLGICNSTQRVMWHELYLHVQYQLRSAE